MDGLLQYAGGAKSATSIQLACLVTACNYTRTTCLNLFIEFGTITMCSIHDMDLS